MSCVNWCNYAGSIPTKTDEESNLIAWEIELSTFSEWFRNEVLKIFEGQTPVIPTQFYIAAHTTECSALAPGDEVSGNGYTRTEITFERVNNIQRWNPSQVASSASTAPWGTIVAFSIWDAPEGGNYYAFGNLSRTVEIAASKTIVWGANKVIIGLGSIT